MKDKQELPEVVWYYNCNSYTINKAVKYKSSKGNIYYEHGPHSYEMWKQYLIEYDYDGLESVCFKWFNSVEECKEYRLAELKKILDRITKEIETEQEVEE